MRPQIVKLLTSLCCFLAAIPMLSQGPSPGGGPPPPDRGPTLPELPIDDNILILMVIGLFFGIYALVKRNKVTDTL